MNRPPRRGNPQTRHFHKKQKATDILIISRRRCRRRIHGSFTKGSGDGLVRSTFQIFETLDDLSDTTTRDQGKNFVIGIR